jgi:SOS response regulatory protein OraA/RecX
MQSETLSDPETFRLQMERLVQRGGEKGTAKKVLTYELQMKYPEAKELVSELLEEYDDTEILTKKAPELLKKYTQEQVVTKLCQKGFNLSDIYTVLRRR